MCDFFALISDGGRRFPALNGRMRFSCDSCQARYTVADEKIRSGTHRVRCKRCGHAIVLRATANESAPEEAACDRPIWFAAIGKKEIGPLTLAQLQERLTKGLLSVRTYVWRDGLANWTRLRDIPLLAALVPVEFLNGSRQRRARRILIAAAASVAVIAVGGLAWLRFGADSRHHDSGGTSVVSRVSP